jgi:hypothetical protein
MLSGGMRSESVTFVANQDIGGNDHKFPYILQVFVANKKHSIVSFSMIDSISREVYSDFDIKNIQITVESDPSTLIK